MRCVESTERIVTPHYLFLFSQHLEIHGTSHFIDKLTKTTLMYWVQSFIQFLHQTWERCHYHPHFYKEDLGCCGGHPAG